MSRTRYLSQNFWTTYPPPQFYIQLVFKAPLCITLMISFFHLGNLGLSEEKMDTIEEKFKESMSGDAQIKEHFADFGQFGEIETVTLKPDMATGCSRGFCSIVYKSVDSLEATVPTEHTVSNKKVAVKEGTIYEIFYLKGQFFKNVEKNY